MITFSHTPPLPTSPVFPAFFGQMITSVRKSDHLTRQLRCLTTPRLVYVTSLEHPYPRDCPMLIPTLSAEPLSLVRHGVVRWLWEPYIPRGKIAILDGDPGVGKSLLALDLAARLSRGGPLPGGAAAGRPHVVLLLSAEDDGSDTLRPRAEAAGRSEEHTSE